MQDVRLRWQRPEWETRRLIFSINLEAIAMMPCNPSIGGTGKGHLVREIDALGGEMGVNIDKTFIQSKMLNTAKGTGGPFIACSG
jgi:tRNA uridine 5-carboxymethylaminomethyl modification enzyme